jgi:hypothetical protein
MTLVCIMKITLRVGDFYDHEVISPYCNDTIHFPAVVENVACLASTLPTSIQSQEVKVAFIPPFLSLFSTPLFRRRHCHGNHVFTFIRR